MLRRLIIQCKIKQGRSSEEILARIDKISKEFSSKKQMKKLYEHLASTYFSEKKFIHAYHYYKRTDCRYRTALSLIHLGDFKEAEVFIDKLIENPETELFYLAIAFKEKGIILSRSGLYDQAKPYFKASLGLFKDAYRRHEKNRWFMTTDPSQISHIMLNEQVIDSLDYGEMMKQSGKGVKGQIDNNNCYSQCYYEAARNEFDQLQEKYASVSRASRLERMLEIEQLLERYLCVNKTKLYFEPNFILLKIYISRQEKQKAMLRLSYTISIIEATRLHDPEELEEAVRFIKTISLVDIESYSQRLDRLLLRFEAESRQCVEELVLRGEQFFRSQKYSTALIVFKSLKKRRYLSTILTASELTRLNMQMLQCYYETSRQSKEKATKQAHDFVVNLDEHEIALTKQSLIWCKWLFTKIEDFDELEYILRRIHFTPSGYSYFDDFMREIKEKDIFIDKKDNKDNIQFIDVFTKGYYEEVEGKMLQFLVGDIDMDRSEKQVKVLLDLIAKKDKLDHSHECFMKKMRDNVIKDESVLTLLGDISYQHKHYQDAYFYFKKALEDFQRLATYEKLVKCFRQLDKIVEFVDILEKFIKFYAGQYIISQDKAQLLTKMFDIWENIVKLATELDLEEPSRNQYKAEFINFLELHLTHVGALMQGKFIGKLIVLKSETHQYEKVIQLYQRQMMLNPTNYIYRHWRDYCVSNDYCRQFKKDATGKKMCLRCRNAVNSQFVDWFVKYVHQKNMLTGCERKDKPKFTRSVGKGLTALKAFIDEKQLAVPVWSLQSKQLESGLRRGFLLIDIRVVKGQEKRLT